MFVPAWVATALLVFMLAQLAVAATWAIHADRRLALMAQALMSIEAKLDKNDLAVLSMRVARLEVESAEHKEAHARNRDRIADLHRQTLDLYANATAHRTPRTEG